MSTREKAGARRTVATVVATAAVTLAVGVTAAALGGYLVPNRDGAPSNAEQSEGLVTLETPATPRPARPGVVLVPVTPNAQRGLPAAAPMAPEPQVLVVAAYEPDEHGDDMDRRPRREHREREHEDDHDDDD